MQFDSFCDENFATFCTVNLSLFIESYCARALFCLKELTILPASWVLGLEVPIISSHLFLFTHPILIPSRTVPYERNFFDPRSTIRRSKFPICMFHCPLAIENGTEWIPIRMATYLVDLHSPAFRWRRISPLTGGCEWLWWSASLVGDVLILLYWPIY